MSKPNKRYVLIAVHVDGDQDHANDVMKGLAQMLPKHLRVNMTTSPHLPKELK